MNGKRSNFITNLQNSCFQNSRIATFFSKTPLTFFPPTWRENVYTCAVQRPRALNYCVIFFFYLELHVALPILFPVSTFLFQIPLAYLWEAVTNLPTQPILASSPSTGVVSPAHFPGH